MRTASSSVAAFAWRGADPLLLGVATLLALLVALAAVAAALFRTPPPAALSALASAATESAPAPAPEVAAPERQAPIAVLRPTPPQTLAGTAQVIDTATLRIGGRVVRLRGLRAAGGEQAARMADYLAGRAVLCTPDVADRYRCRVDGWDLATVALFNGAARAAPAASPELRRAERQARAARRGVWSGR